MRHVTAAGAPQSIINPGGIMRRWALLFSVLGVAMISAADVQAVGKRFSAVPYYGEGGRIVKWDCGGACLPGLCCELSAE